MHLTGYRVFDDEDMLGSDDDLMADEESSDLSEVSEEEEDEGLYHYPLCIFIFYCHTSHSNTH